MAVNNFEACHAVTAKWEGGWSDHAADPGGKTNWGITQATLGAYLRRPASAAEIRALTKEQAKAIYKKLFWTPSAQTAWTRASISLASTGA
jgi:lysozyme family protein